MLSDLRVFTGARVVYALAAARVAGAVSQTAFYDYRTEASGKGHFGAPPTSVEIFLKDKGAHKTTDDVIEGEVSQWTRAMAWEPNPKPKSQDLAIGLTGICRSSHVALAFREAR